MRQCDVGDLEVQEVEVGIFFTFQADNLMSGHECEDGIGAFDTDIHSISQSNRANKCGGKTKKNKT